MSFYFLHTIFVCSVCHVINRTRVLFLAAVACAARSSLPALRDLEDKIECTHKGRTSRTSLGY
jgi:hypothetical protein